MDEQENPVGQALLQVARAAQEEGLEDFLLVGGNAVIIYGVPRSTRDVDFLIPAMLEQRWRRLLERLGFRFAHATRGFSQFVAVEEGRPRVDLMLVDGETWEKLHRASQTLAVTDELDLRLPSPLHLIAMKLRAATSPSRLRAEQDWGDILSLMKRYGFRVSDPEFEAVVRKFGGEAALVKLQEARS